MLTLMLTGGLQTLRPQGVADGLHAQSVVPRQHTGNTGKLPSELSPLILDPDEGLCLTGSQVYLFLVAAVTHYTLPGLKQHKCIIL